MHRLERLSDRRSPGEHKRRARKRARRAALRPLRAVGYNLPTEALEAATADGYSAERFGKELAEEIERSLSEARRRRLMLKLIPFAVLAGIALAVAIAWW